jgi:hypothetical protein
VRACVRLPRPHTCARAREPASPFCRPGAAARRGCVHAPLRRSPAGSERPPGPPLALAPGAPAPPAPLRPSARHSWSDGAPGPTGRRLCSARILSPEIEAASLSLGLPPSCTYMRTQAALPARARAAAGLCLCVLSNPARLPGPLQPTPADESARSATDPALFWIARQSAGGRARPQRRLRLGFSGRARPRARQLARLMTGKISYDCVAAPPLPLTAAFHRAPLAGTPPFQQPGARKARHSHLLVPCAPRAYAHAPGRHRTGTLPPPAPHARP